MRTSLSLATVHNANTACRGYRSFLCPHARASTAVGILLYRYSNVRFCALPCRSQLYSTRTPLVAVIVLFYAHTLVQARRWASCYIAIVMCAFAHFLAARNCTQREHRLSRLLFFFMSTHSCKHGGGGIKKNTLTSESVRVGRSYRNRTYTVGVRGPSATTTPSSIALIIIYQRMAI